MAEPSRPRRAARLPGLGRLAATSRGTTCASTEDSPRERRPPTRTVGNFIGGEERPGARRARRSTSTRPPPASCIGLVARSRRARTSTPRSPPRRAAQPAWARAHAGRARRDPAPRSPSCSSATPRSRRRSSRPRPASRPRRPPARRAARSRWATSWPARAGASTAGRRPAAVPNRQAMTVRQPLGVAGLIIAANTPIANVAWKVFPALLCGNAAVLKASEDTPETALAFARLAARGRACRPACSTSSRAYGDGGRASRSSSTRDVAVVSFTGLDRRRPHDRARRRRAPGQGLPGARRQEPARRLRRRRPRRRRRAPRRCRPSPTPASAAPPAAGSSSSTPSTTSSASCWSSARTPSASGRATTHDFGPVINERQLEQHARRGRASAKAAGATSWRAASASTGEPTAVTTWRRR